MKEKRFELNDDMLNAVTGGTDTFYYRSCTDFCCWRCGYQKTAPEEMDHWCTTLDLEETNRCDVCANLCSCSHGAAFMEAYRG